MNNGIYERMLNDLIRLEKSNISYTLAHNRDEAIMVTVAIPGELWEIEYLNDGTIEIEKYKSNGHIFDEDEFEKLFENND